MFPLFAIVVAAAVAGPTTPRIGADVCKALSAGTVEPFDSLAESPDDLTEPQFEAVRDLVAHYDDVKVASCAARSATPSTITLDIVGDGTTRNAFRRREPIARRWYLSLSASGKLLSVTDEARRTLEALLQARDDRERTTIAQSAAVPIERVARILVARDNAVVSETSLFLLSWAEQHRDSLTEAYALCALGEVARRATSREEASRLFDAAIEAASITQSPDALAYANYLAAMNATERAIKVARLNSAVCELESSVNPYPSLFATYELERDQDDLASASIYVDRLDAFARATRNIDADTMAAMGQAILAQSVSDLPRDAECLERAIASAHRLRSAFWEARAWGNLGQAFQEMEDREHAIDAFRHAVPLLRHDSGPIPLRSYVSSRLGIELVQHGRMEEAQQYVDSALDVPENASRVPRMYALSFLEILRRAQGRCPEAIDAARAAIRLDPTSPVMIWVIQADLADMLAESGDLEGAVDAYRATIDLVEARRASSTSNAIVKARHFATRVWIYRKLENVLLDLHRPEEALMVAEQIKARSLSDSVGDAEQSALTADEQNEEQRLTTELLRANEAVLRADQRDSPQAMRMRRTARAKLDEFEETVAFRHARAAGSSMGRAAAVTSYRGPTVIEFSILEDHLAAYVVRNGRVAARYLESRSTVEALSRHLREEVANHDLRATRDAAGLYDLLFAPIEDLLPDHGEIVIVPDGSLWNVPFAILRNHRHQFLIEKYAIAYAPSIALLDRAVKHVEPGPSHNELLAIGNPYIEGTTRKQAATFRGLSLGSLPDAEEEVRSIAAVYGANRSKVLVGRAATESALKQAAGDYRVIHLATHGILDSESPLYSALVLSRLASDHDDGLLEMREMTQLHLNADLVVLSACDTGTGDIYPGEGIIGMSWAMLAAGCSQVVVSQWTADSRATAELMIEFHRQLTQHRSAPEALRRAELKLLKSARYTQPFYWAPFIVVGSDQ